MEISEARKKELIRKLLFSRTRLLCSHPFFGLLLMRVKFALNEEIETAATDGEYIYFGLKFLTELSDGETDFVLMHEILHVALRHCFRSAGKDAFAFNIACDIVVNSNIMRETGDIRSITLAKYGESMHVAPNGKEGYLYTAEEVYEMLPHKKHSGGSGAKNGKGGGNGKDGREFADGEKSGKGGKGGKGGGFSDDHSKWGKGDDEYLDALWTETLKNAVKAVSIRESSLSRGLVPLAAKRELEKLNNPQLDWRLILNNFVREEIVDYSFMPPDRRYEGDFFLPDFNEKDEKIENILFMIDTSGSVADKTVVAAYSEIKGAIDQFGGKLQGFLGFFDAAVIPPVPFYDENSLKIIRPYGGGGTRFDIIFDYVRREMSDNLPASIIIITDGIAPFPAEKAAMHIPVLWVINNDKVTPPWGKIARIKDV